MFFKRKAVEENSKMMDMRNVMTRESVMAVGEDTANITKTIAIPTVMAAESNFVVIDSTGEILKETRDHLENKGYDIKVINMKDPENSDFYNPCIYEGDKNRVLNRTCMNSYGNFSNKYINRDINTLSEVFETAKRENSELDPDRIKTDHNYNLRVSENISLIVNLRDLLTPEIEKITSKDTVDLNRFTFGNKKTALFITHEKDSISHKRLVNILLEQLIALNAHIFKKPFHTKIIFNDFSEFRYLPKWNNKISRLKVSDISILFIVGSISKLRKYHNAHFVHNDFKEIIHDCPYQIHFNSKERETMIHLYESLGVRLLPDGRDIKDISLGQCHIAHKNEPFAFYVNVQELFSNKMIMEGRGLGKGTPLTKENREKFLKDYLKKRSR